MTENYKIKDGNKSFTLIFQCKNYVVTNEASKLKTKKEVALHTGDKQAAGLLTARCCPQQRFTGVQGVQAIKGH